MQPIGRKTLKSMFKMALGKIFIKLKTALADYVEVSKSIVRCDVEIFLKQKDDLTTHT